MAFSYGGVPRLGLILAVACWFTLTTSLEFNICASFNTAQTPRNESIYQTNGLCHDFCFNDYAYAITQQKSCWCSNYTPDESVQEDGDACSSTCPAFPEEHCGGPNAYAYVELGLVQPSGTRGAATSSSATTEETTMTATALVTETIQITSTLVPSETATSSSSSSSSAEPTTTADPTTVERTTVAPTKTASEIQTVTADGKVRTVTVAPTPIDTTASSDSAGSNDDGGATTSGGGSKGLSTGSVVGIVVGVIGAVLVAAGFALFFFFRRRKQNKENAFQEDPSVRGSSSHRGDASQTGVPASPGSAGNRSSMLQIDPRMDPFKQGLYMRSASHESINTLRDDHDYSRRINPPKVLRATNPDPEGAN